MYQIKKRVIVSAAHHLNPALNKADEHTHGHNFAITVWCRAKSLNALGQVVSERVITDRVWKKLDGENLNDVLGVNPTAENIAKWVQGEVPCCFRVDVEETPDCVVSYIVDENNKNQ